MPVLRDVVFDCERPAVLARFWAEALEGYSVASYDDAELARLRASGITDPEDDPTVLVEGPGWPRLWFQRVDEAKTVKNRVHLDLLSRDLDEDVDRLLALGATIVSRQRSERGGRWVVLGDPEGNELCLVDGDSV